MRIARILFVLTMLVTGSVLTVLPASAVAPGNSAFSRTWSRTDLPVSDTQVSRTWMWGPSAFSSGMEEAYTEGPNGSRIVQYYDKTRMEISCRRMWSFCCGPRIVPSRCASPIRLRKAAGDQQERRSGDGHRGSKHGLHLGCE